jgi:hypothetical protein
MKAWESPEVGVRCSCGRTHDTAAFERLHLVGYMPSGKPGAGELLEIRRCECTSTVSIDLGVQPDSTPSIRIQRLRSA